MNIGLAFIQRWRARQLFEGWHLYRAVPGASQGRYRESPLSIGLVGFVPSHRDRPNRTLSTLGEHATGDANPRRYSNGLSAPVPPLRVPLLRHSSPPSKHQCQAVSPLDYTQGMEIALSIAPS